MIKTKSSFPVAVGASSQRGITLVMGLLFLVVLTILGLAAMRGTILEERMAGNARDRNLAFQAAEAAIRAGERKIRTDLPAVFTPGTKFTPRLDNGTHDDYWQNTHDWAAQSEQLPANEWKPEDAGTSEAPRYVIEEIPIPPDTVTFGAVDQMTYRVTARGVGSNPNTVVILQAIFEP